MSPGGRTEDMKEETKSKTKGKCMDITNMGLKIYRELKHIWIMKGRWDINGVKVF